MERSFGKFGQRLVALARVTAMAAHSEPRAAAAGVTT
jgi:hypothetical protein